MPGLRIIGGTARGRRLKMVPGTGTRPISARAKEALFNILGGELVGATFLDLFAGTGSVGIEALSRGASQVYFVDHDSRAIRTVQENLRLTRLEARAKVVRSDAFAFLTRPATVTFDYVYVAPPQFQGLWRRALEMLDARTEWLNPDAWVIAQIAPSEYEDVPLKRLELFDQRRYGTTLLCFYESPSE